MNKDVVGIVYRFLYRLKNDDVSKEYREKYDQDGSAGCRCVGSKWVINWRNLSHNGRFIYNFQIRKTVGELPINYH